MALFENLSAHASSIAVVNESGALITHDELASTADLIAEFTPERNLIFSFCQNKFECLAGYVGFLRGDCVQLLLQPDVDNLLLLNLIQTYKPKYLFAPISYFSKLPKGKILWTGADYQLLQINNLVDYAMHQDLALLMTTSGTTGSTKLVRLTYENIQSNALAIINYLQIKSTDRAITTMPMSYVYGLSILNTHLLAGASLVITESTLVEKNFWNLLQSTRTTTFGGVPYLYTVLEKLRFEQMVLPSLRVLTQAGGKLNLKFLVHYFNFRWKRIEWNLRRVHNTNISPFANIEKGHIRGELGDIGVTAGVTIGSDVYFGRWVTIAPSNQGAAVIENNVSIWTGATVVGKVSLGSGCTVGANSVVLRSVACGASVLGSPARALSIPMKT